MTPASPAGPVISASAVSVLENAVVRLLKERPFYGHFLLQFRREATAEKEPIGVTIRNGTPLLQVRPDRFAGYPADQQQALLEHVLKHVLHLHPARRSGRHERTWDVACDLAINPGIAHLPPGAAQPGQFGFEEGLAAEDYWHLLSRPLDTGNLEGEGYGDAGEAAGDFAGDGTGPARGTGTAATVDDHRAWSEADGTPDGLAEEMVRHMVRQAWRDSRGEVPGDLRPLVEGWLTPAPIPWQQVLGQFVASAGRVGRRSTWKRRHRRFGYATPGNRKHQRLVLLVAVDVSDSTDEPALREAFAQELVRLARGRESRLTVLYAGSRIQRIATFRSSQAVAEVYHGGGFTDLRPVFDYARTMQPRPAAVIYLTDGFGQAPETMEFPTLWVLTADGRRPAPWGLELRLAGGPPPSAEVRLPGVS